MHAPCANCGAAIIARARTINMADVRMAYVAIQAARIVVRFIDSRRHVDLSRATKGVVQKMATKIPGEFSQKGKNPIAKTVTGD